MRTDLLMRTTMTTNCPVEGSLASIHWSLDTLPTTPFDRSSVPKIRCLPAPAIYLCQNRKRRMTCARFALTRNERKMIVVSSSAEKRLRRLVARRRIPWLSTKALFGDLSSWCIPFIDCTTTGTEMRKVSAGECVGVSCFGISMMMMMMGSSLVTLTLYM
jgi:hypothetical protein